MDTTQKNREEAQRRPRPKSAEARQAPAQPKQPVKRPEGAPERRRKPAGTEAVRQQKPRQEQPAAASQKTRAAVKAPAEKSRKPASAPAKKQRPARQEADFSDRKRAYGNSKPKKKSSLETMGDAVRKAARQGAAKTREKREQYEKKHPRQNTPAVIYTQPQAFSRNRFTVQMLTVTAIVLAMVLGVSVFFKVGAIDVVGADVYDAWTIREASGIQEGDGLLTFSRSRAGAQIKANLPYVEDVRFGIKLPDTVNIIIKEADVVYAIKDVNEQWWLMNSDGKVVEQTSNAKAANHTQVLGVNLSDPQIGEIGVAAEAAVQQEETLPPDALPQDTLPMAPVGISGAQRLSTALQILKALEDNDIVGSAASVNVTRIEEISLWYGTRYQVTLGDATRLQEKIAAMNDVIMQMSDYQSGILDVSFTVWPNKVGYTPFT